VLIRTGKQIEQIAGDDLLYYVCTTPTWSTPPDGTDESSADDATAY
jgi:hypothetical protein